MFTVDVKQQHNNNNYVPSLKVKVTIYGQSSKYVSTITQKSTKANFIKLHRKTRHHKRYAMHHSQRLKVISLHYQNTTEASLIRLHEKVNNNEVICHNQNSGSLPKIRVAQKSKTK